MDFSILPVKRYRAVFFALICFSLATSRIYAQYKVSDTLRLSLPEADKIFIDSNLQLLASHYHVDAQKALIQQAKLWDNPVLNTDQVIAANGKFFPYGKNPDGSYSGQYYIQVQQLITTAGKRSKLVNMATTNAKLSELELQEVLRNLRYQLHIDFFTISQQLSNLRIYHEQEEQLELLLNGMRAQMQAGNLAQKEYLRMQALQYSLQQDKTELEKSIADNEADLKTLLQIKDRSFIKPVDIAAFNPENAGKLVNTDLLFETAKKNNPSYLLQETNTLFQQQNLSYQKSLKVPDITLGPNFDRNSSFAPNYVGLGISLPLPLFNNNKGNIKSAEFSVKEQQAMTAGAETELRNNVNNAYQKLLLSIKQNNAAQQDFYQQYQLMYNNILQSYRQKQISLLEFLDFFNDYTTGRQKMLQQQLNLQLAKEELNYHAGTDILK
jgi:cobalt-zinc-cadmium efflux system outer membrane protein